MTGVVELIVVLEGTFEEVDADGRRLGAIAGVTVAVLVVIIPVVHEAQTALHVAPGEVVIGTPEVRVGVLAEVGIGQGLRTAVDQQIVVEGHVVDLVVGAERERLATDLHADRLSAGLRVLVALVVEHPPDVQVTEEREGVLAALVAAAGGRTQLEGRVVTIRGHIVTVTVPVHERGQVGIVAGIVVDGRPIEVAGGHHVVRELGGLIAVRIELAAVEGVVALGVLLRVRVELIITHAHIAGDGCIAPRGQRTGPEVVAIAVAHGGQLQLVVRRKTAHPQTAGEDGLGAIALLGLGHLVGGLALGLVVPEQTARGEQCTHVVQRQFGGGGGRRTRCCLGTAGGIVVPRGGPAQAVGGLVVAGHQRGGQQYGHRCGDRSHGMDVHVHGVLRLRSRSAGPDGWCGERRSSPGCPP